MNKNTNFILLGLFLSFLTGCQSGGLLDKSQNNRQISNGSADVLKVDQAEQSLCVAFKAEDSRSLLTHASGDRHEEVNKNGKEDLSATGSGDLKYDIPVTVSIYAPKDEGQAIELSQRCRLTTISDSSLRPVSNELMGAVKMLMSASANNNHIMSGILDEIRADSAFPGKTILLCTDIRCGIKNSNEGVKTFEIKTVADVRGAQNYSESSLIQNMLNLRLDTNIKTPDGKVFAKESWQQIVSDGIVAAYKSSPALDLETSWFSKK